MRLAVAGRIIKKAPRRKSQFKAAAPATANIVATTSVANCSIALMTCLLSCTLGKGTPQATRYLIGNTVVIWIEGVEILCGAKRAVASETRPCAPDVQPIHPLSIC